VPPVIGETATGTVTAKVLSGEADFVVSITR